MNLFDLFSLNRHGAYREVLFSSALSYLLNPHYDHGMGAALLQDFLSPLGVLPPKYDLFECVKVSSEKSLDEETEEDDDESYGDIDIIIESKEFVVGIEVKIWDRSGDNISSSGRRQLERYAKVIEHMASKGESKRKWCLLYVVPRLNGKVCAEEFCHVYGIKAYGPNCFVMPLMTPESNIEAVDIRKKTSEKSVLNESVEDLLRKRLSTNGLLHDRTIWLLSSYLDFLEQKILLKPDTNPQRFPSLEDLADEEICPGYFAIFTPFKLYTKVKMIGPNPKHTTAGISYRPALGFKKKYKALYRIRTARNYYITTEGIIENYPSTPLEIELWDDVYGACQSDATLKSKFDEWLTKTESQIGLPPFSVPVVGLHLLTSVVA